MKHWPDTIRAVILCEGQVLLVQHNHRRPENVGSWGLPGGVANPGDANMADTLRREIEEEFGVHATVHDKLGVWSQTRNGLTRQHHVFCVVLDSFEIKLDRAEILAARWFPLREIPDLHLTTGIEWPAILRMIGRLMC